jgi:hypothetical protein
VGAMIWLIVAVWAVGTVLTTRRVAFYMLDGEDARPDPDVVTVVGMYFVSLLLAVCLWPIVVPLRLLTLTFRDGFVSVPRGERLKRLEQRNRELERELGVGCEERRPPGLADSDAVLKEVARSHPDLTNVKAILDDIEKP